VFVATNAFIDGAEAQASAIGFDHTAVYVDHPIQDRTDAEMVDIADRAFDATLAELVSEEGD